MTAAELIKLTLKLSLLLTALGFGLKASPADAFYLFRKPGVLLKSLLSMNLIMPLAAIGFALIFALPPLVKVTLVAISVSPLAPLFPRKTLNAGGREPYVIGLMLAVSILSVGLIPLTLALLEKIMQKPVQISIKAIFLAVLTTVIIPLSLGILIRWLAPLFAGKVAQPLARISQILLIISVLPILFLAFPAIRQLAGNGTMLAFGAFVVLGLLAGHLLGGPANSDRPVLALATASRHPAIALSVASANLPDNKLVPAAILLYLLLNALLAIPYLKWIRKNSAEKPEKKE